MSDYFETNILIFVSSQHRILFHGSRIQRRFGLGVARKGLHDSIAFCFGSKARRMGEIEASDWGFLGLSVLRMKKILKTLSRN